MCSKQEEGQGVPQEGINLHRQIILTGCTGLNHYVTNGILR